MTMDVYGHVLEGSQKRAAQTIGKTLHGVG